MAGALVAAGRAAHHGLHTNSDTGWHNDRPMTPLGLGCTAFRRGSRMEALPNWRAGKEQLLRMRFLIQSNGNSSNRTVFQQHVGSRMCRLYRNEFEAERMGDGRMGFTCRSQSENTDVGDAQHLMNGDNDNEKQKKGEDIGLFNKKGLPSAGAGNGVVHANGSLVEEHSDAFVEAASRTWWERIPRRYIIVGLCFLAFLLCNMDRVQCVFFSSSTDP